MHPQPTCVSAGVLAPSPRPRVLHRPPCAASVPCSAAVPCCIIVANRKSHWQIPYDGNTLEQGSPMEVLDEVTPLTIAAR